MLHNQIKSRLQCARKMQSMFWPTGRRLRLAGIKTLDGSVVGTDWDGHKTENIIKWGIAL